MSIQKELDQIKNAVYGKEVRGAIHDGIKKAYDDASKNGNANMEVSLARGKYPTLNGRLENLDQETFLLNRQLADKPGYNTTWSMENMAQDVKTAMSGGSVAVVGENAVGTINVTDSSIKTNKMDSVLSDLIGIENIEIKWVMGQIQLGNINYGATTQAISENFIHLDKDVTINFSSSESVDYYIAFYNLDGTFTQEYSDYITSNYEIKARPNQKIRIAIRYKDERVIDSVYPLTQYMSIVKELDYSLKNLYKKEIVKNDIPNYWLPHLEGKITDIKNLQKKIGFNGTSFAFITDTHWGNNSKNSPALLKKIMDECEIPYCFDGGDFASNPGGLSKQEQINEIVDYKKAFSFLSDKVLRTIGNHDDNSIDNKFSKTITDLEMYDLMFRKNSFNQKFKSGKTGEYYYVDDETHKIRYITLNCIDIPYEEVADDKLLYTGMFTYAFRQEQVDWFSKVALNVPDEEYAVVVSSHVPVYASTVINQDVMMNILQAFKNKTTYIGNNLTYAEFKVSVSVDYTQKGGDVICWLAGHEHVDAFATLPSNITYKQVITLNDSLQSEPNAPQKILGTNNENAFDIFTIDKVNKSVKITRVGAGSNRSFFY